MIERLSRSERWIIAERQRRLSYVLVVAPGVFVCFGVAMASPFSDLGASIGVVGFVTYIVLYVVQLYLIIGLAVNYRIAYSLLWSVVILLAFTPLVQWGAGVVLCLRCQVRVESLARLGSHLGKRLRHKLANRIKEFESTIGS